MRSESPSPGARSELDAVRAGEPEAIDRWYRAQHPEVWRLCLGFLGSSAEAEDAAQEAMLKLHDQLERWDPSRGYEPWRNALVLNLCRDRLRRRGARDRAEGAAARARSRETRQVETRGPGRELEQHELRERIQRALRHLTDREREAFVLRELEGATTARTAEVMAVTQSSVRSLLTLARGRLREHLAAARHELLEGGDV